MLSGVIDGFSNNWSEIIWGRGSARSLVFQNGWSGCSLYLKSNGCNKKGDVAQCGFREITINDSEWGSSL